MMSNATILDKINVKFIPPLPPKSRMGKWRVSVAFRGFILDLGGLGFEVPFYFNLSKIVVLNVQTRSSNTHHHSTRCSNGSKTLHPTTLSEGGSTFWIKRDSTGLLSGKY